MSADVVEDRYRPVLELATGRVVGAELVGPDALTGTAARAFAFGPAAEEGWSLAAPFAPRGVGAVLRESGMRPERLVLRASPADLAQAVATGAAARLAAVGVRFSVVGFGMDDWSPAVLRSVPVASIELGLSGLDPNDRDDVSLVRSVVAVGGSLGLPVLGRDIETDDQLALAGEAGVALVQGYWWGSAGSLAKLVATWGRERVSG